MAGRPTKDDQIRDTQIHLRVSSAEKAKLAKLAKSRGVTLSELLLESAREKMRGRGK